MTTTDFFLLPLDPTRGLRRISDDLDGLVVSDPRFRDAKTHIERHFRGMGLGADFDDCLLPALWVQLRERLSNEHDVQAIRQVLATDGTFSKSLEVALDTRFAPDVTRRAIQEIGALTETDSTVSRQVQDARDELNQISTTYGPAKIIIGFCLVVIVVALAIIIVLTS